MDDDSDRGIMAAFSLGWSLGTTYERPHVCPSTGGCPYRECPNAYPPEFALDEEGRVIKTGQAAPMRRMFRLDWSRDSDVSIVTWRWEPRAPLD
jgi:hypothetical protein